MLYDITLTDGTILSGYTIYKGRIGGGGGTITVGYDGHKEDPTLPPEMIGERRIVNLVEIKDINLVG